MKKILILVNHDIVIYNFRFELVEYLIKNNYEVHISSPNGERIPELINIGAYFHETIINRHGTNIKEDFKLLRYYYKLVKNINPDMILSYTIKPNIYGGIISNITKTPYIPNITGLGKAFNNNSSNFSKQFLKYLYSISVKKSHHTFFQNQSNLKIFNDLNLLSKSYSLLPGSGVNVEKFNYIPYPSNDKKIVLLYIGRVMRDKGINELLEAAKKIDNPNIIINIMGFIDDIEMKNKIEAYSEEGYINYLGFKNNVSDFLKEAHAVILPSYHEGMSNVLLEAASSGRPILASNIPGCRETFDEEKSGLSFEPGNVNSIVDSINKFNDLSHDEKITMGKSGRQKMIEQFDRKIVIDNYMEVIKK